MSPDATDAVWIAAWPLIAQSLGGASYFDDLSFSTSNTSLYVTAGYDGHLDLARGPMFDAFTKAGWGFKQDKQGRNRRLIFSLPTTQKRPNLRLV